MEKIKYYVKIQYKKKVINYHNRSYNYDRNVLIRAYSIQEAWVIGVDYFMSTIHKESQSDTPLQFISVRVVGYYNKLEDFVNVNLEN